MSARPTREDIDARVRTRLRELRARRGLTLAQVASRANLDISTLSRLESGKRRLALDHIPALAAGLGVSADDLLAPAAPPDPRVRTRPITRWGLTMWPLTRQAADGGPQAYKILIDPGRDAPPDRAPVHEGHDWIYVMSGRMRLVLGDQDMVIEPGEAVEFSTWTPHWFGAVDGPVEVIALLGPQGERVHLRSAGEPDPADG